MDTRGDLLFVLVLISSGLVSGNQWILGGRGDQRCRSRPGAGQAQGRGRAGVGGMGWTPGASLIFIKT